jgi:hypothetical protein
MKAGKPPSAGYYAAVHTKVTRNPGMKKLKSSGELRLTLVTIGALLGIILISGNAEHVVALDADAMDKAVGRWRDRLRRFARFRRSPLG